MSTGFFKRNERVVMTLLLLLIAPPLLRLV